MSADSLRATVRRRRLPRSGLWRVPVRARSGAGEDRADGSVRDLGGGGDLAVGESYPPGAGDGFSSLSASRLRCGARDPRASHVAAQGERAGAERLIAAGSSDRHNGRGYLRPARSAARPCSASTRCSRPA